MKTGIDALKRDVILPLGRMATDLVNVWRLYTRFSMKI
jgi:hypothetical protein